MTVTCTRFQQQWSQTKCLVPFIKAKLEVKIIQTVGQVRKVLLSVFTQFCATKKYVERFENLFIKCESKQSSYFLHICQSSKFQPKKCKKMHVVYISNRKSHMCNYFTK